jgi:hypothetical protein
LDISHSYCSRTTPFWKEYAIEMYSKGAVNLDGVLTSSPGEEMIPNDITPEISSIPQLQPLGEKEVKRIAFSLCQTHYEETLPIVRRLAELEESIGQQEEEGGKGKDRESRHKTGKSSRKG